MLNLAAYKNCWVFFEVKDGQTPDVGYELLNPVRAIADQLGEKLVAVIIGNECAEVARKAIVYGADEVLVVDDPGYAEYNTDTYTDALTILVRQHMPSSLFVGGTTNGCDLAPRAAVRLETGLTHDCTELGVDEKSDNIAWTRPAFGGDLMAVILDPETRPQMGTVRPGVFKMPEPDETRTGTITNVDIPLAPGERRVRLLKLEPAVVSDVDLASADVIVSGGKGVGSAANFTLIKDLAHELGGVVGASRKVIEAGWMPFANQVGQSGKSVRPKLYIAAGISGAIQHVSGIAGTETVIAINRDPDAPIFDASDFGIVGDLNEVIPQLITQIRVYKSQHVGACDASAAATAAVAAVSESATSSTTTEA